MDAKLRLRAYLHLATNAHAFYLACDDARKRLCIQAFFTKITLTENLDVRSEFTGVYETVLNPTNRLHAEFWQRTGQLHPDIHLNPERRNSAHRSRGQGWNFDQMVELRGLEPLTPSMPWRCATSCATAPYLTGPARVTDARARLIIVRLSRRARRHMAGPARPRAVDPP